MLHLAVQFMKKKLLLLNIPLFRASFARFSLVSLVFAFVKINAFTAALLMSNLVDDIAQFGVFEYALSIGLMVAIPLNFGLQGAYPFFNLKLKKKGYQSVFYFHSLVISFLLFSILFCNILVGYFLNPSIALALLIAGIYANQIMFSSILKSHNRVVLAALLDGGLFLILNGYNLFLFLFDKGYDLFFLHHLFLFYFILLMLINIVFFMKKQIDFSIQRYFKTLSFGKNIVGSTFLMICLTGSARIFIEYFLGAEAVGFYGFYFRLAAITVLVHQVVNIAFFKKMYEAVPSLLDQYFSCFLLSLCLLGLAMQLMIPVLFGSMFQLLAEATSEHRLLYILLSFQMLFWIALALNENIIHRENLAAHINRYYFLLLLMMIALIFGLEVLNILRLSSLIFVNMLVLFGGLELQIRLLQSKNIHFPKTQFMGRVILVLANLCLLFFNF